MADEKIVVVIDPGTFEIRRVPLSSVDPVIKNGHIVAYIDKDAEDKNLGDERYRLVHKKRCCVQELIGRLLNSRSQFLFANANKNDWLSDASMAAFMATVEAPAQLVTV